jgi:hypothetical protein
VLDITAAGIVVRERVEGLDLAALQACTGVPLLVCRSQRALRSTSAGARQFSRADEVP